MATPSWRRALLLVLHIATLITCSPSGPSGSSTTTESPQTSTRRTKPLWNATQTDRLKHDLLLGYDKFARPHAHDKRTEVDLLVVIKHVSVDEFAGIMSMDAWVKMFWTDPKLVWNPAQYGNMSTLYVADHEIWQPDIMLYNSATGPGLSASHYETSHLIVTNEGGVIWVPMTRLEVYCLLDLTHWPFDTHTCEFRMGSWVYDKANMDIVVHNETFTFDPHVEGEPWKVLNTEFERKETLYNCCPELYVDVSFKVTATRRGAAYHSLITVPLFASILLLAVSFWIPIDRSEKLYLHGVNILMLVVALMYLMHVVPVLTKHTPNIVHFYASMVFLVVGAIGFAAFMLSVARQPRPWPVPWPVRLIITTPGLRWMLYGAVVDEMVEASRTYGSHPDSIAILPGPPGPNIEGMNMENSLDISYSRNKRDWYYFAVFLERFSFCFNFIAVAVLAFQYA